MKGHALKLNHVAILQQGAAPQTVELQFCHISGQWRFFSVYSYRVDHPGQDYNIYTHSKADRKLPVCYFIAPQKAAERGAHDRTEAKTHPHPD